MVDGRLLRSPGILTLNDNCLLAPGITSQEETHQLHVLLERLRERVEALFANSAEQTVAQAVPCWPRAEQMDAVLQGSLASIVTLHKVCCDVAGYACHNREVQRPDRLQPTHLSVLSALSSLQSGKAAFSADELRHLIKAIFDNTDKRAAALAELRG